MNSPLPICAPGWISMPVQNRFHWETNRAKNFQLWQYNQ